MFEYLMPLLVMPTYDGTLLDETYRAAVARQIEYGRERGVPWGISESGYNTIDAHAQLPVPRVRRARASGFKRGLADDLVIAPYATRAGADGRARGRVREPAAPAARGGSRPLRLLRGDRLHAGARCRRGKARRDGALVHGPPPGHGLLALAYVLLDRPMQRRFARRPARSRRPSCCCRSACRRAPPRSAAPGRAVADARPRPRREPSATVTRASRRRHAAPEVHLLVERPLPRRWSPTPAAATAAGSDLAVTRWREDATRDAWGTFCYLRDVDERRVLVDRATSRRCAAERATRRSSTERAPSSAAATARSRPTPRSSSRPRTTSSCAA